MVLIFGEEVFSVVVNHPDFGLSFEAVDVLAACLVVAVDYFIADGPHEEPTVPNACYNLRCPEKAGFLLGVEATVGEVFVLEACPLGAETSVKKLAPSNQRLLVEEVIV